MEVSGIRLSPSAALKEKRLHALLGGRDPADPTLRQAVEDAQLVGSLELAGIPCTREDLEGARGGSAAAAIRGLREARAAVPPGAPFSLSALLAWHRAATGRAAGFRRVEYTRPEGPPPAPAEFITDRLEVLEQWLGAESGRELGPAQQGALVLVRLVDIVPFEEANGRVSRLAASHLMERGGMRPAILVGADRQRLETCLHAAFRMETEPITTLLREASERALDVMIRTLEKG
jgi:hypothetical protein